MRLTDEQVRQYDEDGYVVLHGILTPAEVRLLQAEAEILRTDQRGHPDANVYEKDGVSLRAAWCVEMDSEACRLAMSMKRIFGPVRQLMGERAYLYQSRLNYKVAGRGDVFQWHQDYGSWVEDGVPSGAHREMLSVLVMLD
ncbi:MAG: phytanoyl-CoA dioxygenase family protein, partial [Parvibaculum sp.]